MGETLWASPVLEFLLWLAYYFQCQQTPDKKSDVDKYLNGVWRCINLRGDFFGVDLSRQRTCRRFISKKWTGWFMMADYGVFDQNRPYQGLVGAKRNKSKLVELFRWRDCPTVCLPSKKEIWQHISRRWKMNQLNSCNILTEKFRFSKLSRRRDVWKLCHPVEPPRIYRFSFNSARQARDRTRLASPTNGRCVTLMLHF